MTIEKLRRQTKSEFDICFLGCFVCPCSVLISSRPLIMCRLFVLCVTPLICREEECGLFERRPEAIHLFGTDDLSTQDILDYFSEYSPHHIEWLDDSHCKYSGLAEL